MTTTDRVGPRARNLLHTVDLVLRDTDTVLAAWTRLREAGCPAAPVLDDDDHLVGLAVTDDLFIALCEADLADATTRNPRRRRRRSVPVTTAPVTTAPVTTVAVSPVVSLTPGAALDDLDRLFAVTRQPWVLITDGRTVLGAVGRDDVRGRGAPPDGSGGCHRSR